MFDMVSAIGQGTLGKYFASESIQKTWFKKWIKNALQDKAGRIYRTGIGEIDRYQTNTTQHKVRNMGILINC